jgi:hypothetical protein
MSSTTFADAHSELELAVHPAPAGLGSLATAWVDLDAIAANVRVLADAAREASLMAVVKADAFGHGAVPVEWGEQVTDAEYRAEPAERAR